MSALDPEAVAARLCQAARMFRFMNAADARLAMRGKLRTDGLLPRAHEDFAAAVARRLEVLRALNRRRDALRAAVTSSSRG